MKKLINLILLLVILSPIAFAQKQYSFVVHFDYDKFNLKENEKNTLDELVKKANSFSYYEMAIYAHTDIDGSAAYNLKLSENRAQSVKNYMISQGLIQHQIMVKPLGKNAPIASNDNEMGKQANRRVEIVFTPYNFNSPKDILTTISDNYTQTFTIPTNDVYTIKGKKGTSIEIPCDAFVLPNGKPVSNKGVTFELEEYQSFTDAIFNRLTTQSNGAIIESGGMMKLSAKLNDIELSLKPGKELNTLLPSSNIQSGMKVFVGVQNPQGFIEWDVTENDFKIEPKDKSIYPKLIIDSEVLKRHLLPTYNPRNDVEFSSILEIQIPILPNIGTKPREPKKPKYPEVHEVINPFMLPLTTKKYRTKKTDKEYNRRLEIYNKRFVRYENKLAIHERRAAQHGISLSKYDRDLENLYNQFDTLIEEIKNEKVHFVKAYNITRWNLASKHFIMLNDQQNLEYFNAIQFLRSMSNRRVDGTLLNEIETIIRKEEFVKSLKLKTYHEINKMCENGLLTFDASNKKSFDKYSHMARFKSQNIQNSIADDLCENQEIKTMFSDAERLRSKLMSERGLMNPTELNSVYRASVQNLGMINCDRFSSVPQNLMTRIDINKKEGEEVSLILTDINSILNPYHDAKGYYVNVPMKQKFKMIVVGLKEGKPTFENRTFVASNTKKISTNAKEVNLETLKSGLEKI